MKMGHHEAIIETGPGGSGQFILHSGYDAGFVGWLKLAIPSSARRWDPINKHWLISDGYVADVRQGLADFGYTLLDDNMAGPTGTPQQPSAGKEVIKEVIRVNYLGNVRQRGPTEITASGMDERGQWLYVFPLPVLQAWFGVPDTNPLTASTYYEALGLSAGSDAAAVKRAYRQAIKRWHPDICPDPDAHTIFLAVQAAYDVLSDERKRKRYDLAFSIMQVKKQADIVFAVPGRWRCGYVTVSGEWHFGKLVVAEIHGWQDIIDRDGLRMTATWVQDHVEYEWV
jgi:hypothetical protein